MSDQTTHPVLAEALEDVLRRRAESLAQETTEEEAGERVSLLLFRVVDEWYAVGVEQVREIFQECRATPVPCVPEYVMGVVNVRGEILSVTDVARLMNLGKVAQDEMPLSAIVVHNDECETAMVVDEVGDIADIPQDAIEPPASVVDRVPAEFVAGSAHVGDLVVGLVNLDAVLTPICENGSRPREGVV